VLHAGAGVGAVTTVVIFGGLAAIGLDFSM